MKILAIMGCVLALAAAPAFAANDSQSPDSKADSSNQSAAAADLSKEQQALPFEDIDTDGDGYISPVEAYVAGFETGSIDTDEDGRLSKQEYDAAMARSGKTVTDSGPAVTTDNPPDNVTAESHLNESLGQADTAPETDLSFDEVDSNKDGVIDKQEAAVAELGKDLESFKHWPITRKEYEEFQAKRKESMADNKGQQSAQADTGKNADDSAQHAAQGQGASTSR